MELKNEIKVGGVVYALTEKPFIEIDGSRDFIGNCDYQKAEIAVLSDISDERKDQTVIHELTHAIFYEAGYEEQDEDMINRVGKVLHQVLIDNFD
ncbi:hypothetical protein [Enterococcus sp. BWR-S5]|uniref:hypothetical protein n=1 Tax=Enterococcus sp. BWR-S5 TaxID=2787714 RepID=UPI0019209F94|nr:hypothetical protein [Enterococcus sp. BWR-S5]MBL1225384.1 hypothetical protein [Enterococcus sp. BWR-S5]